MTNKVYYDHKAKVIVFQEHIVDIQKQEETIKKLEEELAALMLEGNDYSTIIECVTQEIQVSKKRIKDLKEMINDPRRARKPGESIEKYHVRRANERQARRDRARIAANQQAILHGTPKDLGHYARGSKEGE